MALFLFLTLLLGPGGDPPATAAEVRTGLLYGPSAGDVAAAPAPVLGGETRSIPLAFGLSAVVPGLGQAYNGHWIKAAAAIALEGVIALAYVGARREGLDEQAAYEAYAHTYWSPVQYARWLNDYADFMGADVAPIETGAVAIDFSRPDAWGSAERAAAKALFDEIRAVERQVEHPNGSSFSHNLPYFGEQQYYELIGKYFQFAPGWVDYPGWREDGAYTSAIDPEATGAGGEKVNVSDRFWAYDAQTAHANDLLRRASRLSAAFVVNHLVAAIDAAVFAKLHNDRVSATVTVAPDVRGAFSPRASISLRL